MRAAFGNLIAVSNSLDYDVATVVFDADKNVVCEKPLVSNKREVTQTVRSPHVLKSCIETRESRMLRREMTSCARLEREPWTRMPAHQRSAPSGQVIHRRAIRRGRVRVLQQTRLYPRL